MLTSTETYLFSVSAHLVLTSLANLHGVISGVRWRVLDNSLLLWWTRQVLELVKTLVCSVCVVFIVILYNFQCCGLCLVTHILFCFGLGFFPEMYHYELIDRSLVRILLYCCKFVCFCLPSFP